jgi:hypothetical protein
MIQLIESIKELSMALYGAEISERDIEHFNTIGKRIQDLSTLSLKELLKKSQKCRQDISPVCFL